MNQLRQPRAPVGGTMATASSGAQVTPSSHQLSVAYADGLGARAHPVLIWVEHGMLQLSGPGLIRQIALNKVQWRERTHQGKRMASFHDGARLQALDAAAWDVWLDHHALAEPHSARPHQSGRWSLLAATVLVMVATLGYWWGLPLAARWLAPLVALGDAPALRA